MPQSPQSHVDAIPQFRQECQAASTPVLEPSPKPNYSTRLIGSLWRAGMVIGIVKSHFGAYGMGVEYAYTMVHGASATKFPEYTVPAAPPAHK